MGPLLPVGFEWSFEQKKWRHNQAKIDSEELHRKAFSEGKMILREDPVILKWVGERRNVLCVLGSDRCKIHLIQTMLGDETGVCEGMLLVSIHVLPGAFRLEPP